MIELSPYEFWYFFMWSSFGQIMSIAVQQVKYHPQIKREGGFQIGFWLRDNFWRMILTIGAMVAGIIFTKQITGIEINEFVAFLAGFATDKTVDSLTNRKK